jgi:hypothetical protein
MTNDRLSLAYADFQFFQVLCSKARKKSQKIKKVINFAQPKGGQPPTRCVEVYPV